MGDQRKLAENDGAPRMKVTTSSSRVSPADLDTRRLARRVERLERKVRVLERDANARRLKKEFEAKPGDV